MSKHYKHRAWWKIRKHTFRVLVVGFMATIAAAMLLLVVEFGVDVWAMVRHMGGL